MIWNLCIRRPTLTIVIFLVIAIFGFYGYRSMPVRENPDVDFPIVSVNVVLPGAEPEVIETEIIEPLEEQINTIEGLKELRSTAREQVGTITAEFELWRDIDTAAQDVRDRVDRARRELPDDIEAPIVRKLDPDARAIMWIALTGDQRWDAVALTRYADEVLKERLENLRGVGQILIGGERLYAVRVRLDPAKLASHHVTVQDVVETIRRNNVKIPSGRIESREREFLVKTRGRFSGPGPMNNLIIAESNGAVTRIEDVGEVVDGVENERQLARFVRQTTVGLGVVKQTDANTVALADAVQKRMAVIAKDFPPGLQYTIAADDSAYIEQSIDDLIRTIFAAGFLVMLVVLTFLRSVRGTLITGVAIPTSLLGGFAVAYLTGFSLNILTLLAFILAIGIVIDDSIVVLESSFRQMEAGEEALNAARVGTSEVAFPSIVNTLALAAVFMPVAFTAGLIGRFFLEFSLSVAATVAVSTFTALTLTSMLCSRLLELPESRGRLFHLSEKVLKGIENIHARLLKQAFKRRLLTVIFGVLIFALGIVLFRQLETEFAPTVDRSEFIVSFETPEGSTLRYTNQYAQEVEQVLVDTPEVKHFFMAIGLARGGGPGRVNEGIVFVKLVPPGERRSHQSQVMQQMRNRLGAVPGGQAYVVTSGIGPGSGAPLQLVLQYPDLRELAGLQARVMNWMRGEPEFVGVNSDLKMNKPEVTVAIHRDKASQMGISVTEIANTMRYLLGDTDISEIEKGNERYEVIPEVISENELVPASLENLYVRNAAGALISMGNLVGLEETIGPSEIHHFNRLRAATISASNPPGQTLGEALAKLEQYLQDNLPRGFDYTFTGQAQDFQESFYYLTIALVFSVVFIYLVLAAQFESFVLPMTILMTIPLAGVGAFGLLWILDMPFSIYSFIGIIMLTGMVTKNAILLIDYTNVLRARGKAVIEAAEEAAGVRFRPVVMTTVSTVLGIMPIALGLGAGGEARAPLGVTVAAGLVAATGLTLIIIPVVYTLFDQLQTWIQHRVQGLFGRTSG